MMTAAHIVERALRAGLNLTVVGGDLRAAPSQALTPELRALLRERKHDVIGFLGICGSDKAVPPDLPGDLRTWLKAMAREVAGEMVPQYGSEAVRRAARQWWRAWVVSARVLEELALEQARGGLSDADAREHRRRAQWLAIFAVAHQARSWRQQSTCATMPPGFPVPFG